MTITLTSEEAQQVLEALEAEHSAIYGTSQTVKATELLRARLAQPEPYKQPEDNRLLMQAYRAIHEKQPEPEPVAWVENLTDAQPHAVTDLKYCSVAQHERGEHLKYIPLYADPTPCQTCEALARTVMTDNVYHENVCPKREWQGLTDEEMLNAYAPNRIPDSAYSNMGDDLKKIHDAAKEEMLSGLRAIEAKLKEMNSE